MNIVDKALQDERCWVVYIHIAPNNKRYVGITSNKNPKNRWGRGGSGYKGQPFYDAIKKYGWGNFKHEIVASNLTCDEANDFEITLIRELDTLIRNGNGYNTTEGGKGTKGCNTDRSMYTGENATNVESIICLNTMKVYGCAKLACDEYGIDKSTLSKYLLGRKKYKSCGKSHDGEKLVWAYYDESKPIEYYISLKEEKMTVMGKPHASTGGSHHNAKPVICLTTGEIFETSTLAVKKYNAENIAKCCRNEYSTCGKDENGNRLKWMYLEDYEKLKKESEAV